MRRFTLGGSYTPAGGIGLGTTHGGVLPDAVVTTFFNAVDLLHPVGHNGLDLACAEGTEVRVPQDGIVAQAGALTWQGPGNKTLFDYVDANGQRVTKVVAPGEPDRGGNVLLLLHQGPFVLPSGEMVEFAATLYAHLREVPALGVGQAVKAGDVVAHVGTTGYSTGPHLHLALAFMRGAADLFPPDMSAIANLDDPLPYIGAPAGDDGSSIVLPAEPVPVDPALMTMADWSRAASALLAGLRSTRPGGDQSTSPFVRIWPGMPPQLPEPGWRRWTVDLQR